MTLIASFLISILIAILMVPMLIRFAPQLGLIDQPNERKVHSTQIPRIGGVAIVIASLCSVLLWTSLDQNIIAFVCAGSVLLAFGLWDDKVELGYKAKFGGQFLAVVVFLALSDVYIRWFPLLGLEEAPRFIGILVTGVALLGITNAVNLLDGLDGLAGGTTLVSLAAIALLAFTAGAHELAVLSLAICGGIIGFLRYNTHPARVFMGDTGSQFLGFSVGVAALMLTQGANTALSPALPLLLLGLPILDTLTVMYIRIREGRSPFSPDKQHFHHRLMALGFAHYEAVSLIYLAQVSMILIGSMMRYENDASLIIIFLGYAVAVNGLLYLLEKKNWKFRSSQTASKSYIRKLRQYTRQLKACLPVLMGFSLVPFLVFVLYKGSSLGGVVPLYVAIALFGLASSLVHKARYLVIVERMFWYALCGLSVYISQVLGLYDEPWVLIYFWLLALFVVLAFQRENNDMFSLTPLDLIVLLSALVMFYFGQNDAAFGSFGLQVTQIILFLYAVEFIVSETEKQRAPVKLSLSVFIGLSALITAL